jgi:hypothetical protein
LRRICGLRGDISRKGAKLAKGKMKEMSVRVYQSLAEMKADEYRYWQSRPVHERMDAVSELTTAAYALKGISLDVPGLQGPVVLLPRPRR